MQRRPHATLFLHSARLHASQQNYHTASHSAKSTATLSHHEPNIVWTKSSQIESNIEADDADDDDADDDDDDNLLVKHVPNMEYFGKAFCVSFM
eukprot:5511158-Amphidinium_carterae.2